MESRSSFVTVLAWITILGSGFTTLISIMQIIMISTMFNGDEFTSLPNDAPAILKFMTQNFRLIIYTFFALALFTFISSIALLKRKNWARLVFMMLLAFGIFWHIGGLFMQHTMFSDMPALPQGDDFERIFMMMRWFTFAIAIAFTILHIWMIKKLTSPQIVAEFTPNKTNLVDTNKASSSI